MTDLPSRDAASSWRAKKEGIERTLKSNRSWSAQVGEFIVYQIPWGSEITGEDIRFMVLKTAIGPPKSSKAWGGVINGAVKRRLLARAGREEHMSAVRSHHKSTPVYRRMFPWETND